MGTITWTQFTASTINNHIRDVFVFDGTGKMAEDPKPSAFLTRSGLIAHQWLVGTLVEADRANVRAVGVLPAIVLVVVGLRVVGGVKGGKGRVVRTTPHFVMHRQNGLDRKEKYKNTWQMISEQMTYGERDQGTCK